jgi:hypothetical protein
MQLLIAFVLATMLLLQVVEQAVILGTIQYSMEFHLVHQELPPIP